MAKYRKVDSRIWNDEKFRSLSDNGKLVFFMLLTHPHMTSIGAMRHTIPGMASEMGWTTKAFGEAFAEALSKGMAKHDEVACFVWLPKFISYNPPENPNVLKAWESSLDLLPECALKNEMIQAVKAFTEGLTEAFQKALPEPFRKGMPKQEQEQEQEQEPKEAPAKIGGAPLVEFKTFQANCKVAGEKVISDYKAVWDYAEKTGIPKDWIALAWRTFARTHGDSGKKYKDWRRTFKNCIEGNWMKLWYFDAAGNCLMSSNGFAEQKFVAADQEAA